MRLLLMSPGFLVALALAGCNGSSDSATPTAVVTITAELSPEEVLERSAAAARSLTSFHFELEHEGGSSPLPLDLKLVSASGDVEVPDRLAAEIEALAGPINISVEVISIGDQTWITNPFSRRWQELPGASVADFADPTALVDAILSELKDVRLLGSERISGAETHHIGGTLDSGALRVALPFAGAGLPVRVEVWIGEEDNLPRRARLSGPVADGEPDEIVRIINLSSFDEPVEIQPPE